MLRSLDTQDLHNYFGKEYPLNFNFFQEGNDVEYRPENIFVIYE